MGEKIEKLLLLRTGEALRQLGITENRFRSLIRLGHLQAPERDSSGAFVWTEWYMDLVRQADASAPSRPRPRQRTKEARP